MSRTEQVLSFQCGAELLHGILASPPASSPTSTTGVVVIVGGPQYRAGSHRQFVLLARTLADAGFPVLRFDYRGMGDSTGGQRDFLQVAPDIAAAIDAFAAQEPAVRRVVLWGLCDGASAALLYCHDTQDPRVQGLCLLNPWVRSEATLARTHVKHYYAERLRQKEFWRKLLSGKVALGALTGLWRNIRTMHANGRTANPSFQLPFQQRMALAWREFPADLLLVLSGADYTAKEFEEHARVDPAWAGLLTRPRVTRRDFPDADHTFSSPVQRQASEEVTLQWLHTCVGTR